MLTDRPEERFVPGALFYREGRSEPLTIQSAVAVADGPGWRLRFHELPDRTAAESLRGAYLETVVPQRALAEDEYYWHEVIGVTVTDVGGRELGTVSDVYRVGESEVYVVRGGPAGEFDVPAVKAFIRTFAPRSGEIVVDAAALDLRLPPEPVP